MLLSPKPLEYSVNEEKIREMHIVFDILTESEQKVIPIKRFANSCKTTKTIDAIDQRFRKWRSLAVCMMKNSFNTSAHYALHRINIFPTKNFKSK